MTEHSWATDAWPAIYDKVLGADILVMAGPIWLGDNSSVTKQIIERLLLLAPGQRRRPVRLLRPGGRLPDHRRRGRGPSYLGPKSGAPENDFTNRNTTFLTWNLMHLARMLRNAGGIPVHGRSEWDAGCRFDFENPTIPNAGGVLNYPRDGFDLECKTGRLYVVKGGRNDSSSARIQIVETHK